MCFRASSNITSPVGEQLLHIIFRFNKLLLRIPVFSRSTRPLKPNSIIIQPRSPDEMQSFQNEVYPYKKYTGNRGLRKHTYKRRTHHLISHFDSTTGHITSRSLRPRSKTSSMRVNLVSFLSPVSSLSYPSFDSTSGSSSGNRPELAVFRWTNCPVLRVAITWQLWNQPERTSC